MSLTVQRRLTWLQRPRQEQGVQSVQPQFTMMTTLPLQPDKGCITEPTQSDDAQLSTILGQQTFQVQGFWRVSENDSQTAEQYGLIASQL